MNFRYGILSAALAVGIFALPASAAVTDVTGGNIDVNTTINKHYNEIDGGTTQIKGNDIIHKGQDKVIDKSGPTKVTVNGRLDYNVIGNDNWSGHEVKNFSTTVTNPSNVNSVIDQVGKEMFNYLHDQLWDHRPGVSYGGNRTDGEGNYFFFGSSAGNTNSYNDWQSGTSSAVNGAKKVSESNTYKTTTKTKKEYTGRTYGSEYERKDKMTTVLTRIESSRTVNASPNSIMVGDPDAIASAYAAQGNVTVDEVVDKYYDRTHYYEQVYHNNYKTWNEITKTGSKTIVYQLNAYRRYSPIILDLDGDGKIEASNGQYLAHDDFSDKVAAFDFFGNGFPVLTEWVGVNDGLLCRPTADGKVTGAQLFGSSNGMANGYEEMASLDADENGALEGAELQGLKVWTDLNGDAVAQAHELKSLEELGITSIKVTHNNYSSTFERNGQTYKTFDWWPNCREMRKVNLAGLFE